MFLAESVLSEPGFPMFMNNSLDVFQTRLEMFSIRRYTLPGKSWDVRERFYDHEDPLALTARRRPARFMGRQLGNGA
jgi:hypothetical protein